ncbi:MAG: hypothetical protein JWL61_4312 [Gemmatimonadetes bacterium]|jgi:hypothetical protein|nr:hypothetical protein [Gemmatimonadota bacterium]
MTRKIGWSVFALVIACGAVSACGTDSARAARLTAPQLSASARNIDANGALHRNVKAAATACATHLNSANSDVFGPAGGTLTFGSSRLIIPAGALRDTVTITATIPEGDDSRVEFQPHGLEFAKPAGLQLSTAECSMNGQVAPNVVYLSETGEILETIEAVYDPHWQTIAASIWHFSGYAIAF